MVTPISPQSKIRINSCTINYDGSLFLVVVDYIEKSSSDELIILAEHNITVGYRDPEPFQGFLSFALPFAEGLWHIRDQAVKVNQPQ